MLTSSPPKNDARPITSTVERGDHTNDLRFISELGRSLLVTVHPKKVASRVAEAIQIGVDAGVCVFVAELDSIGLITCAFGNEGEIEEDFLNRKKFEKWLDFDHDGCKVSEKVWKPSTPEALDNHDLHRSAIDA